MLCIPYNNTSNETFCNLEYGDTFLCDGKLYIKCATNEGCYDDAICLETGMPHPDENWDNNTIIPVKAKVYYEIK